MSRFIYLDGRAIENKMASTWTRGKHTVGMRKCTFHYNIEVCVDIIFDYR